jgi:hypothetical protein
MKTILIFVMTCYISQVGCSSEKDNAVINIPSDFKIFVKYKHGFSGEKGWNTTITTINARQVWSSGIYEQPKITGQQNFNVTQQTIRKLIRTIHDNDFYQLSPKYTAGNKTDLETLILTITMANKTHTVEIYGPEFIARKSDVKRFLNIWDSVLMIAPSPNEIQQPGEYFK